MHSLQIAFFPNSCPASRNFKKTPESSAGGSRRTTAEPCLIPSLQADSAPEPDPEPDPNRIRTGHSGGHSRTTDGPNDRAADCFQGSQSVLGRSLVAGRSIGWLVGRSVGKWEGGWVGR